MGVTSVCAVHVHQQQNASIATLISASKCNDDGDASIHAHLVGHVGQLGTVKFAIQRPHAGTYERDCHMTIRYFTVRGSSVVRIRHLSAHS